MKWTGSSLIAIAISCRPETHRCPEVPSEFTPPDPRKGTHGVGEGYVDGGPALA